MFNSVWPRQKDEPDAFKELGTGNRVATWLFYVSMSIRLFLSSQVSAHNSPCEIFPLSDYLFFLDKIINHFVSRILFSIIHVLIVLALLSLSGIGGDLSASSCSYIKWKVLSSQSKSLGLFITAPLSSC